MKKKDGKKGMGRGFLAAVLFLALLTFGGCSQEEKDEASLQVLKITVAPDPTATPIPVATNADAVVSNGNLTMTNSYLLNGGTLAETDAGE
ncbi:MAG: hypothetical protein LUG62_06270 [Clostridiales bacterium]|nr:hypothetical protein [Clostridiales bacterium]